MLSEIKYKKISNFLHRKFGFDLDNCKYSFTALQPGKDCLLVERCEVIYGVRQSKFCFLIKVVKNNSEIFLEERVRALTIEQRKKKSFPIMYDYSVGDDGNFYFIYEFLLGPVNSLIGLPLDVIVKSLTCLYLESCEPWGDFSLFVDLRLINLFYDTHKNAGSMYFNDIEIGLQMLTKKLDEINEHISSFPLVFSNCDFKYEHLFRRDNGCPVVIDWGSCRPNFVGADFHLILFDSMINQKEINLFNEMLKLFVDEINKISKFESVTQDDIIFNTYYSALRMNLEWAILYPVDDEFRKRLLHCLQWFLVNLK